MKNLLTALCLSATVFSAVAATAPAHALDQMFNPDPIKPETPVSRLAPPTRTPFGQKAELTIQSRIMSGASGYFVQVVVKNEGHVHSGIFTTRVSIKHRFQSSFTVYDVKMFIRPGGLNAFRLPASSPNGPQLIQSRAVADVLGEVREYDEQNNRSLINLSQ